MHVGGLCVHMGGLCVHVGSLCVHVSDLCVRLGLLQGVGGLCVRIKYLLLLFESEKCLTGSISNGEYEELCMRLYGTNCCYLFGLVHQVVQAIKRLRLILASQNNTMTYELFQKWVDKLTSDDNSHQEYIAEAESELSAVAPNGLYLITYIKGNLELTCLTKFH